MMSLVDVLRPLLAFVLVSFAKGQLDNILSAYETLHSRDLHTHHLAKRTADLYSLYNTEREVSFSSFGRTFRLRLYQHKGLFSDNMEATEVGENHTRNIYLDENEFYMGFLDGESRDMKTFAYWENDDLVATIRTRNDMFFIEPSWRHLPESDNYTMIVYRLSDVKNLQSDLLDRITYCSPPDVNDSSLYFDQSVTDVPRWNFASNSTERSFKREKRASSDQNMHTMCTLMLVADYRFTRNIGKGDVVNTAKYMIGTMSRVNGIYMSTDFGGPNYENLGFKIEGIIVYGEPSKEGAYNKETTTWDTNELLNAFSSNTSWNMYCLVHLFTSTAFDNGVLGLAWVANDKIGSLGGICSQCTGDRCYNTGWSTAINKFQNKLTTLEADLVTAHELGHGWGSQHDPDRTECAPSSADNGKYIMYPFSVSGRDPNNDKFSPCSIKSIQAVLQAKKDSCFDSPTSSVCGNYKVEDGEQCDAGIAGKTGTDKCCDSQCRLVTGASCSDLNDDCCLNCTYANQSKLCWSSADNDLSSSCRADSYCTGGSTSCPETKLPDGRPCSNGGHCRNGSCLNVCEYDNEVSCVCDDIAVSCVWCCRDSENGTCRPKRLNDTTPLMSFADGYPCQLGYCQAGKCQKSILTTPNRAWDFIQNLNVNEVALFMRNNVVLATVIISLIPYVAFCAFICVLDSRKRKKVNIRDAWLHKDNDRLIMNEGSSNVRMIDGIVSRRPRGNL